MSFDESAYLRAFRQSLDCTCTGCQWMRAGGANRIDDIRVLLKLAADGASPEQVLAAGRARMPDVDLDEIEASIDACACAPCTLFRERQGAGVAMDDIRAMSAEIEANPAPSAAIEAVIRSLSRPSN